MCLEYFRRLVQFCGNEALSVFEVLGGVEFDGEETGGVDDAEGVALRDETLEGTLVENVDETLVFDHLLQLVEEGGAVVGCHLLDAYALASGIGR